MAAVPIRARFEGMGAVLEHDRSPGTGADHRGGPASAAARLGYAVAVVINVVMLYVVNQLLEWDIVPFLTAEFDRVLPLVNLSLAVSIGVNVVRLLYARAWFVTLTDLVATGFGLPALIQTWRVFPFEFDRDGFPWDQGVRVILVVAIAGSAIAMVVGLVKLIRLALPPAGES